MAVDARARHAELARKIGQPDRSARSGQGFEDLRGNDNRFDRAVAWAVFFVVIVRWNHAPI